MRKQLEKKTDANISQRTLRLQRYEQRCSERGDTRINKYLEFNTAAEKTPTKKKPVLEDELELSTPLMDRDLLIFGTEGIENSSPAKMVLMKDAMKEGKE